MPHATPVTMTTTEDEGEANIDPDSDLEPVTAFESVTPAINVSETVTIWYLPPKVKTDPTLRRRFQIEASLREFRIQSVPCLPPFSLLRSVSAFRRPIQILGRLSNPFLRFSSTETELSPSDISYRAERGEEIIWSFELDSLGSEPSF